MTEEQVKRRMERAMVANNIVYVIADSLNTFLLDMCCDLDSLGLEFKQQEKQKYNELLKHIHKAHYYSEMFAKNLYDADTEKEVEDAAHDSDWWYLVIKLLYDRLGDDKQKTHMFLEFLDAMPSEGYYKVGIEDFQKI